MLAVPVYKQSRSFDCGAACAKAVLAYWELRYPRLSAAGWPSPIDGTDPRVLEALFRKSGLQVVVGEFTVGLVRYFLNTFWPVVCLVRQGGVGHWVVVQRVARNRVHFMDPDGGESMSEPLPEFLSRWQAGDVCRSGAAYYQFGIAAGIDG